VQGKQRHLCSPRGHAIRVVYVAQLCQSPTLATGRIYTASTQHPFSHPSLAWRCESELVVPVILEAGPHRWRWLIAQRPAGRGSIRVWHALIWKSLQCHRAEALSVEPSAPGRLSMGLEREAIACCKLVCTRVPPEAAVRVFQLHERASITV